MALRELTIEDIAVIRHARLDTGPGFTVITGETGSGKSMCIAALRAVIGERLETDLVRTGSASARVRAVFDDIPESVQRRLAELGVRCDDEVLVVTREFPVNGRAVSRINGDLVSATVIREVAGGLVDVTAQGASHRLVQPGSQRTLVDLAGGAPLQAAFADAAGCIATWRDAVTTAATARADAANSAAVLAAARDTVDRLGSLELQRGEEEQLAQVCLRLRHAAGIRTALAALADAAGGDGTAADTLAATLAALEEAASVDPQLDAMAAETEAIVDRLHELALDARRAEQRTSVDPDELAAVEARLQLLNELRRRYGSVDAAIAELDRCRGLLQAGAEPDRLERLDAEAEQARAAAATAALRLSALRTAAARDLERAVTRELRRLDLGDARFRVLISRAPDPAGLDLGDGIPVRCQAGGVDAVEFRLATHPDMLPAPLAEGPSGGELSRLALALAACIHDDDPVTLVLDEVDTGLGGDTAARVGEALAAAATHRQIVAITHRAEIAARAGHHLRVRRSSGGAVSATAEAVTGKERVEEMARLLSGTPTDAARRRAREMLAAPAAHRARPRRATSTM